MILDMSLATRLPQTLKQVRPVLSTDHAEAKRRVLNLYKIWLRQIPYIRVDYIKNNWTETRLRDVIKVNKKVELPLEMVFFVGKFYA